MRHKVVIMLICNENICLVKISRLDFLGNSMKWLIPRFWKQIILNQWIICHVVTLPMAGLVLPGGCVKARCPVAQHQRRDDLDNLLAQTRLGSSYTHLCCYQR